MTDALIEQQFIERKAKSKQPRFRDEQQFLKYFMAMIERFDQAIPPYTSDTRKRDEALQKFVRSENLLSGVLAAVISRDKNRGWSLTGTARQVSSYGNKMHGLHNDMGWRHFVSLNSTSYYSTNFGYINELGFETRNGRATTMWNMDPTKCYMSGNPKKPVVYVSNSRRGDILLSPDEFIHGNSMPSIEEEYNGIGLCAVDRVLTFTRIMMAINSHNLEKLDIRPPKGILFGKGITQREYSSAVEQAEEEVKNMGAKAYAGIMSLFSDKSDASLQLIAMSELPENFVLRDFVEMIMQAYSLAFGYPVGEFWAIESGSFGRAGEMKAQTEQATDKGELEFALSFQEQIQRKFLPETVHFKFDQRDDKGDLVRAEVLRQRMEMIWETYGVDIALALQSPTGGEEQEVEELDENGNPVVDEEGNVVMTTTTTPVDDPMDRKLLTREEARKLMAQYEFMPQEWTEVEEDLTVTDLQEFRERTRGDINFCKHVARNMSEPVVLYHSNPLAGKHYSAPISFNATKLLNEYEFPQGYVTVLWEDGNEFFRKRVF